MYNNSMRNGIIDDIDESNFIYLQNEKIEETRLGVDTNKIVEIPNFIDPEVVPKMIDFFENCNVDWGGIAFYGSLGKGILSDSAVIEKFGLPGNFFNELRDKYQEAVEKVFGRKVRPNTSHAQKWEVGGFASPHSDNSDHDGNPNAFEINKYVGVLYLNDNYRGGELYFCDKDNDLEPYLSFKPNAYSYYVFPGGHENIHGVSEIVAGTRYTMVSFWDFEEIEYSEEIKSKWEEELKSVRKEQEKQREEWEAGNKFA
jgi:hypothetical protein